LGHQCSHAPGRPILHFVSSSRRPRRVDAVGSIIDGSSFEPFLCLCLAAIPLSRPAHADAPRARTVKAGRRAGLASRSLRPGHALTGPRTARWSSWSGRHLICLDALEGAPLVEDRPGDAGELVCERNRQHVVVQALSCGLDPRLEPVAAPARRAGRRSSWRRTSWSGVVPPRRLLPHRESRSSVPSSTAEHTSLASAERRVQASAPTLP
jgi:hypothetical protein